MVIHTETGTWVKILKVTIREVKKCNRVNVKRFIILVNCRVQFFFFHKTLSSWTRSLLFLIIPIWIDLPRSGDFYTTTPQVNSNSLPSVMNPSKNRKYIIALVRRAAPSNCRTHTLQRKTTPNVLSRMYPHVADVAGAKLRTWRSPALASTASRRTLPPRVVIFNPHSNAGRWIFNVSRFKRELERKFNTHGVFAKHRRRWEFSCEGSSAGERRLRPATYALSFALREKGPRRPRRVTKNIRGKWISFWSSWGVISQWNSRRGREGGGVVWCAEVVGRRHNCVQ